MKSRFVSGKHGLTRPVLMLLVIVCLTAGTVHAQFLPENHYLGPTIGFSFLGSAPEFGASYEYGMMLEEIGLIGIGGIIRYWSYSAGWWSYTDLLIGVQGNYHFKIDNEKFSPFAGVVLAYDSGNVSYKGPFGELYVNPSYGGLWLGFQGGARYWLSPNLALAGRLGVGTLGYYSLTFGVDFKL